MKRLPITLGITLLAAFGLAGCGDGETAAGNNGAPSLCADGEEVTSGGARACLYRNPLIEEGFDCPPELAFATQLEGALLCAEEEQLPPELVELLESKGYDGPSDGTGWNVTENNGVLNNGPNNGPNNDFNNGPNNDFNNGPNNGIVSDLAEKSAEFDWFVAKCNAAEPLTEVEHRAHFSDDLQFIVPLDSMVRFFEDCQKNAPLTVDSLDTQDELNFLGHLTNSDGAGYQLNVSFEPGEIRIDTFDFRILDQEDADRTGSPQAADELFLRFADNLAGRRDVGATVELLDPATGLSFTPAVSAVTNNYGFVRLTAPDPANPVTVKFTGTDGYSTIFYNDRLVAGIDEYRAIVSRAAAEAAAQRVGRTLDPTEGIGLHFTVWGRGPTELFGCATATSSPAAAATHYVDLTAGDGWPTTTRTSTDPAWSTAWHFGLAPGPVDFTMSDATATASSSAPMVEADATTIVVSTLETSDHPYNPTAASCFTAAPKHDCSMEGTLRSIHSRQTTSIMYENPTAETRKVWWLDAQGFRMELGPFAAGARHLHQVSAQSFYMISDEADNCLAIYETTADDLIAVLD